jgi:hypothetical protein
MCPVEILKTIPRLSGFILPHPRGFPVYDNGISPVHKTAKIYEQVIPWHQKRTSGGQGWCKGKSGLSENTFHRKHEHEKKPSRKIIVRTWPLFQNIISWFYPRVFLSIG